MKSYKFYSIEDWGKNQDCQENIFIYLKIVTWVQPGGIGIPETNKIRDPMGRYY